MLKWPAIVFLTVCCFSPAWGQSAQPASSNAQSPAAGSQQSAAESAPVQSEPAQSGPGQGESGHGQYRSRHHRRVAQAATQDQSAAAPQPATSKPENAPAEATPQEQKAAVAAGPPVSSAPAPAAPTAHATERSGFPDTVYEWGPWVFGFLLVLVGGLQVWLLLRTGRAIQEQNAMHAAGMTQWVDLRPHGVLVNPDAETDQPMRVTASLQWKIVNRTSLPLTLQAVEAYICRRKDWEVFEYAPKVVIPPVNAEGRPNHYVFLAPLHLTKAETKRFLSEGIPLSVTIGVTYEDAMGREKRQDFGDMYACGVGRLEIKEPLGDSPSHTYLQKDDSPLSARKRDVPVTVPEDEDGDSFREED